MAEPATESEAIDDYIAQFPPEVRAKLTELRRLIATAAPDAKEKISYQMPTFYLGGNLVHFAAFTKHIGLYPGSSGVAAFEDELAGYVHAKGSIQFPLTEPLPLDLIRRIVEFRVGENEARQAAKKK